MSIGPASTTTSYSITDLDNVDHSLSTTDCEKDLGIWISSTLCPSVQCQKSYTKVMQSLATIKLDELLSISQKSLLTSYTKHTSDHTLNTASRLGAHIMQRTYRLVREDSAPGY